jgi:hypothetical protein
MLRTASTGSRGGSAGVRLDRFRPPSPFGKEPTTIVVRNVFQLKFGKAREAVALFKENMAIQKRVAAKGQLSNRLLTDMTGDLSTFEGESSRLFADKDWQANYQKIAALVDSGRREVFSIVE